MLIKEMKFEKKNPEHARKVNLTMPQMMAESYGTIIEDEKMCMGETDNVF